MRPVSACARALTLALSLPFVATIASSAQASFPAGVTASRSAEISGFAEISRLSADYCPCTNTGVVLGAAYTHFSRLFLSPSLEIRGSIAPGSQVKENTLAAGLRLQKDFGRLRPFANLLAGGGTLHFTHPTVYPDGSTYSRDGSAILQFGGGVGYAVNHSWSAQVEVQAQKWNLGGIPPVTFAPVAVNFGVVYHIPFRPYRSE